MSETPSLREWLKHEAEKRDVPAEELLLQSQKRDPMWKGTRADHAKAEWFARYWQLAVSERPDDEVHPRGVHYLIDGLDESVEPPTNCSWTVYQNTEKCFNYLKDASILARVLGYIPLDGVLDNKHQQTTVSRYGEHSTEPAAGSHTSAPTGVSVPQIPRVTERAQLRFDGDAETFADYAADRLADELIYEIEIDPARQAAFHIELWCEKSLPGAAKDLARRLGVNVVVEGEGDLSYTVAADLADRIQEAGKPATILYLSDFDPKGDNMAVAMASKLAWLKQRGDLDHRVTVEQLAVTRDQIEEHDLPRKPISGSKPSATGTGGAAYDTLVNEWEERKGTGAVELQALWKDHDIFMDILEAGLSKYIDADLSERTREAKSDWRDEVREVVREAVDELAVGNQLPDLQDWLDEFNDELEDAQGVIADLREMINEGAYAEWKDEVQALVDILDVPAVEVPEGEAPFPDDPLYDSARDYGENLARVRQHKEGR